MQEIIQQLVEKAGLSEEQAEKSLQVIKEYIQSQLPPMMQGMVDNFLGSQNGNEKIGE
jgi:nucleoid DNA-binding protein